MTREQALAVYEALLRVGVRPVHMVLVPAPGDEWEVMLADPDGVAVCSVARAHLVAPAARPQGRREGTSGGYAQLPLPAAGGEGEI